MGTGFGPCSPQHKRTCASTEGRAPALTITNASSSQLTLTVMLIIALIGVPIMLVYTAFVYRRMVGVESGASY